MTEQDKCMKCGSPLTSSVRGGLCPACLLKRGLETNTVGFTDEDQAQAARRWTPPSVEQLAPIFPELDILELIGRGGMGAVYKAREKQLDRLVALKILPPEIGREPAFAQGFAREAQAMAKLGHTNIVTIYSFGQRSAGELAAGGDLYFFIMEYVDGLSLRQLLDAGTVSPKEAITIVPQICDALQYAHDRGIVHRDIKPENILMNRQGQVKIADFGLAKLVGLAAGGTAGPTATGAAAGSPGAPSVTQAGEKVMGTPQYMAPEQIDRPAEVDHRADIYSLGVVFYQMLTGELPVGRFEPPSHKVLIDVRLDEVVLRALEREPARRYQQVSQVRTQVETIVGTPPQGAISSADKPVHPAVYGWEYRSKRTLFGLPLIHVANGMDPETGRPREARGIIAYGAKAKGVIAIGGQAYGVVAVGGFAAGLIAFGGFALGLFGYGGFVLGLLVAYGGLVAGPVALGGIVAGIYADGGMSWNLYHLPARWANFIWISFYIIGGALLLGTIPLVWLQSRSRPRGNGKTMPTASDDGASSAPREAVKAPAICLIVAAAVSLAVVFTMAVMLLSSIREREIALDIQAQRDVAISHLPPGALPEDQAVATPWRLYPLMGRELPLLALLLGIVINIPIIWGAIRMMQLRNRGLAITAAILALIASPGNIIGLPMGIWALVVLSRREVIEAFQAGRETAAKKPRSSLMTRLIIFLGLLFIVGTGAIALPYLSRAGLCTIEGRITDALTGKPISGARVADNTYGGTPTRPTKETWTDNDGKFVLQTWREEHTLVASAPSYQSKLAHFEGKAAKMRMDFALQPTEPVWHEALIPDADTKGIPVILDLASGEMLSNEGKEGKEAINYFTRLGKGDIGFDRVIFILRGGKLTASDGKVLEPKEVKADASAYDLASLPHEVLVRTGDDETFQMRIVSVTPDGGLRVRYAPVTRSDQKQTTDSADARPWTGEPNMLAPLPVGQTASFTLKPPQAGDKIDTRPCVDLELGRESTHVEATAVLDVERFGNQLQSLALISHGAELREMPKGRDTRILWNASTAEAALALATEPGTFFSPVRQAPYVLAYKTKSGQVWVSSRSKKPRRLLFP